MNNLFDLCAACGHARVDHDGGACEVCRLDLDLHNTFLALPATAHLEAEVAPPTLCAGFVDPRGRREGLDPHRTGDGVPGRASSA